MICRAAIRVKCTYHATDYFFQHRWKCTYNTECKSDTHASVPHPSDQPSSKFKDLQFGFLNTEDRKNRCFFLPPQTWKSFWLRKPNSSPYCRWEGAFRCLLYVRMTSGAYLSEARSGCTGVCPRRSQCSELYCFVCKLFSLIIPMQLAHFLLLLFILISTSLG